MSQLKYRQRWFIHHKDVLRDDRFVGGPRTIVERGDVLQRHSRDQAGSFENRDTSENKDLLSANKMLFVGVKW